MVNVASDQEVGVFRVPIQLRNYLNRHLPPERRGEDLECEAVVDSGATELALPADLVERLRLEELDTIHVRTADGGEHRYRVVGIVELGVQGRTCHVRAIELPRGATPLLGAVPLELMDWHISPQDQKLLPNPESPDRPLLPLY